MKSLIETLADARQRQVGVGHFNFSDLTAFKAIVESAVELNLPVMVGVSEGEREFIGVAESAALVKTARERHGLPIFLNADHTHSLAKAVEAAKAGFDEIIFDGSALPFDKNVEETRRAVETLKSINPGIVVEGEIGYIGSASAILEQKPEGMSALSTPEEARQFVEATKVDVLAPAVGNMHGMLESMVRGDAKKRLDLGLIAQLAKATGALMTLHGGSGTNDNDFRTAIKNGISIVHVNTEIRIAWRRGVEAAFKTHPKEVAPYKILPAGVGAIKEIVTARLKLFNFM
ncbi:MAG: class II fructose-bisphosphate aldolase [Xanthobacteraceae bacterium]